MTNHELPLSVSDEIIAYFEPHFRQNSTDFVCVYGSSLYKDADSGSDIDLFLVTNTAESIGNLCVKSMSNFIRTMHLKLGRKIDEEVPYENKINYSTEEVASALSYFGFDTTQTRVSIPDVVKESSFLMSPEIKARLALNALTSPHTVFGLKAGLDRYITTRKLAEESVTLLAANLVEDDEFDHDALFGALTTGSAGQYGEMYLGYKTEHPIVVDHLNGVLEDGVQRLSDRQVLKFRDDSIVINRKPLDPVQIMRGACSTLIQNIS